LNHRRKHVKPYGITWNESVADSYTRIGQGKSCAVGVKLPNNLAVLESMMKRCVSNDAGVVQYYLDPTDSTKKVDGTPSVLTGADGQVMVEIPQGWLKYWYSGTTHNYLISKEQFNGASRFNSHYKNGEWVDKRYIGAYEGTLYDVSASIYTDGIYQTAVSCVFANADSSLTIASRTGVFSKLTVGDKLVVSGTTNNNGTKTVASLVSATKITVSEAVVDETAATTVVQTEKDWTATTGDKLCSISGKAPINYGTRANFRAVAKNRGTGWRQEDYDLASAIQLLYLVEYASFYSQSVIGNGLTDWSSAWPGYNDYNPINNTGLSNAKGNTTFNLSNGNGVVGSYMTYRGIENWYGHLWKLVDGININNNIPYVSNNDTQFADNTTTNYTTLGVTLINSTGWQNTLCQTSRGFLPVSVGAASSTKITDYYYQAAGWRVVALGGRAHSSAVAGAFSVLADVASGDAIRDYVGRLAF
jgi:predicted heme/steroid binding protein